MTTYKLEEKNIYIIYNTIAITFSTYQKTKERNVKLYKYTPTTHDNNKKKKQNYFLYKFAILCRERATPFIRSSIILHNCKICIP